MLCMCGAMHSLLLSRDVFLCKIFVIIQSVCNINIIQSVCNTYEYTNMYICSKQSAINDVKQACTVIARN